MMKPGNVLMVDGRGLTVYRCRQGAAAAVARFPRGDVAAFGAYLKSHADDVYAMLADIAEESYELEYVPHVRGRNRHAMMARKQERHAHGSPLCVALPRGRQSHGRRDDGFLFAALAPAHSIEPWLHILAQSEAALSGVYSLPQVLAEIAGWSPQVAVLASLGCGGVRQTLIVDGQLRFSRLTALPKNSIEEAAAACAAEAVNLHRYLCAQRLAGRGSPLSVIVLAHPADVECFRRHCRDTDELHFDYLDLVVEAKRRGLTATLSDSFGDSLFVHLLVRKPPRRQFAPAADRWQWRLRSLRRVIDATGFAGLAAALAFAAIQLPGLLAMREDVIRPPTLSDNAYAAAQLPQPHYALPATDLRDLGANYETLVRASPGPAALLIRLSQALDDLPAIELDSLEWRVEDGARAEGPFVLADIHGRLASGSDPRNVERLAERLRAEPAMQAAVLKAPFAMESERTVKSMEMPTHGGGFILHLVQKL